MSISGKLLVSILCWCDRLNQFTNILSRLLCLRLNHRKRNLNGRNTKKRLHSQWKCLWIELLLPKISRCSLSERQMWWSDTELRTHFLNFGRKSEKKNKIVEFIKSYCLFLCPLVHWNSLEKSESLFSATLSLSFWALKTIFSSFRCYSGDNFMRAKIQMCLKCIGVDFFTSAWHSAM